MSNTPGSVLPSADQLPPFVMRQSACAEPLELFGIAKWSDPRMTPLSYGPVLAECSASGLTCGYAADMLDGRANLTYRLLVTVLS